MCFVWIWEQTAIISLCSINWLVCITETECVYCAVRTGSLYIIQVIPVFKGLRYSQGEFANYEPSGHYMYRHFNIQQFYVLPTQTVFMCFVWIWEQTAIISLYSINWLVCITETESVYCAVRTGSLYIIQENLIHWSIESLSRNPIGVAQFKLPSQNWLGWMRKAA